MLFYLEFYKSLEFKTQEIEGDSGKTSPRRDLNPRPTAYEAVALPLSYEGTSKHKQDNLIISFSLVVRELQFWRETSSDSQNRRDASFLSHL